MCIPRRFPKWAECNQMSWSPDGKSLIFPEALDKSGKARLSLLSLSDLTARPLTSPHNQQFDCDPVFSPDGARVAFARGPMGAFLSDLFVLKVADGQLFRLTTGNSGGPPPGRKTVRKSCSIHPLRGFRRSMANFRFGRDAAAGCRFGGRHEPSISRRGNQLAYLVGKCGTPFGGST